MEIIIVDQNNIEKEHICCAISDKKGENCVASKKDWMKKQFQNGLVFQKANVRGKVFIEYIPSEHAWYPILADNYMHINCFWVAGQYQGQGLANQLLDVCIQDAKAKGKCGLTVLSSTKKMPYLSDPKYLKYKGFQTADTASPSYELLYLPFTSDAPVPSFRTCAKQGKTGEQGFVLYYTNQCPHTAKYVPLLMEIAKKHNVNVAVHKIESEEQAQNAPAPFTSYSFFNNGNLVTHEIMSEKKFEKYLETLA